MNEDFKSFGETAKGLSGNPLGIIALFIVLVYGFASLVVAFAGSFATTEKLPLIYFLVLFPVLVLVIFTWLVSQHSEKLYSPSDMGVENYTRMQELQMQMRLKAASISAAATIKTLIGDRVQDEDIDKIFDTTASIVLNDAFTPPSFRNKRVLWVDDKPENNAHERMAFEVLGLTVSLARSTEETLVLLKHNKYEAIISDMGRNEGTNGQYVETAGNILLQQLRKQGDHTPFFIYAGTNPSEEKDEASRSGAQVAYNAQELFISVMNTVTDRAMRR